MFTADRPMACRMSSEYYYINESPRNQRKINSKSIAMGRVNDSHIEIPIRAIESTSCKP